MEVYGRNARQELSKSAIDSPAYSLSFIVVTSRGDGPELLKCLCRILEQEPHPENIVLVLNGCTLGKQVISLLESPSANQTTIKILSIPLNVLPSEARNLGAHAALGRWIIFIDDDGFISAEYTKSLLQLLASKAFIACRGKVLPIDRNLLPPKHYDLGENIRPASLEVEGNLVFNKNAFFFIGGFDPLMYAHEGINLYERCITTMNPSWILYSPFLVLHHNPSTGVKLSDKIERNRTGRRYLKAMQKLNMISPVAPKKLIITLLNQSANENLSSVLMSLRRFDANAFKIDVLILSHDTQVALRISRPHRPFFNIKVLSQSKTIIDYLEKSENCLAVVLATCAAFPSESFYEGLPAMLLESSHELLASSGKSEGIGVYFPPASRLESIPGKASISSFISKQCSLHAKKPDKEKKAILLASFYTPDDYYKEKALSLESRLNALGIDCCIKEIRIPAGLQWPDICRKKIQYIYNAFRENCDSYHKIGWIDVDCSIDHLPGFLLDFQVDLIGFSRGFPHSSHRQRVRTRFWEPCFFVFQSNDKCQNFLQKASKLEEDATSIKATDDFFFEEAWRENREKMTYFCIPGEYSTRRASKEIIPSQYRANGIFFEFGESGNVEQFKGKVEQHAIELVGTKTPASENSGITVNPKPLESLILIAKSDKEALARPELTILNGIHEIYREQVKSLMSYEGQEFYIPLFWWIRPAPGNMGDWLSPYILHKLTGLSVAYSNANDSKLVALGSVGRYIKDHHTVWGTGISACDTSLNTNANYIAVRGPYTAKALKASGGAKVDVFGDPGILMRDIFTPIQLKNSSFKYGFVRHFIHQDVPLTFEDGIEDLNILVSSASSIENFVSRLASYTAVLTTSLHVIILCHAYHVPCRLVSLKSQVRPVHGDGIKYRDFYEGASLKPIPHATLGNRILRKDFESLVSDIFVPAFYGKDLCDSLMAAMRENPFSLMSRNEPIDGR
jgi:hypothetical protein